MLPYKKIKPHQNEIIVKNVKGHFQKMPPGKITRVFQNETYTIVPTSICPGGFEMKHLSSDNVPMTYKGIFEFIITDPVAAVQRFDFSNIRSALSSISEELEKNCQGKLRDIASRVTMEEAISKRTEKLSDELLNRVVKIVSGEMGLQSWGIDVIIHVDQVFPSDQKMREQLESPTRERIREKADLSHIDTEEKIKEATIESEKRISRQEFEKEREEISRKNEKIVMEHEQDVLRLEKKAELERKEYKKLVEEVRMKQELEEEELKSATYLKSRKIQEDLKVYVEELKLLAMKKEVETLKNEVDTITLERENRRDQANVNIRKQILPIEQMPALTKAMADGLRGSRLTLFSGESDILQAFSAITGTIIDQFRGEHDE